MLLMVVKAFPKKSGDPNFTGGAELNAVLEYIVRSHSLGPTGKPHDKTTPLNLDAII
jgi:hypothetical protein